MILIFKRSVCIFALLFFYIKPSIAEITFLDIIENPSDLKINLQYAKQQEALGRYKATLATLERLNMLYPVNTDLKLYLISILLKMDSASKLQLMIETMLQDQNTTKETRDYIEEILKTIKDQLKPKPKWFAYLDLYYKQTENSNIDGVSKSGTLFLRDDVREMDGLEYDKTYSRGGSITVGKNLSSTSAISFNAGLSVNTQNKGVENQSDVASGSISYSKVLGKNFLIPYMYYSRPNQRHFDDYISKGVGFNNSYNINKNNSINYSTSYSHTNYKENSSNLIPHTNKQNSDLYSASIGYNLSFSDINLISSKISYSEKKAKEDFYAYSGTGYNIGYTRILPIGNIKLDRTFQTNDYYKKNPFAHSTINREDDIITSKIQLSGRLDQLLPFMKGGKLFYNINYSEIDSRSTLLQNESFRKNTSFNITKRFSLYE